MFLGQWGKRTLMGLALGSCAIAGCAGMTHSMDVKGEGHIVMDHDNMEHGSMIDHGSGKLEPATMGEEGHGEAHGDSHGGMHGDTDDLTRAGHGHGGMHHGSLEIPEGQPTPQLTLTVEPDTMRGWNLQLETANFEFAPERVNQTSVTTEGHAHLFINGKKITRLYGPWYYIPDLPEGEHELRVELNGNGHEVLTVDGEPVEATAKLTVPAL